MTRFGRRVTRVPLGQFLSADNIDCVLDVGANEGQYAQSLRTIGYKQEIKSFEPLQIPFQIAQQNAAKDKRWSVFQYALGDHDQKREINVSAHNPSSSFLQISPQLDTGDLDLSYVGKELVEIKRLDDVYVEHTKNCQNIFLKIDTQGFEKNVIQGALKCLHQIRWVQMELSLIRNYDGETLIEPMIAQMREIGFDPWWVVDGYRNPKSLQLYQCDVFFRRR